MTQDEQLRLFKQLLLSWTAKINLIGPEARENIDAHIDEALEAAEILRPHGDVLDFGSGGGLPAFPMAIASPSTTFHLVEADQKKWAFLKHAARECSLNLKVYGDRLTAVLRVLAPELRFSLVTSRAVGSPASWIPELMTRLDENGRVALFQGSPDPPEIEGLSPAGTHRLARGEFNYLVVLEKRST